MYSCGYHLYFKNRTKPVYISPEMAVLKVLKVEYDDEALLDCCGWVKMPSNLFFICKFMYKEDGM